MKKLIFLAAFIIVQLIVLITALADPSVDVGLVVIGTINCFVWMLGFFIELADWLSAVHFKRGPCVKASRLPK